MWAATAWLLVGIGLFVVGLVALLGLTSSIVVPVIAAGVIAAVAAPLVAWLQRHRVPRPLAAILLLLVFILLGALVVYVVVDGDHERERQPRGHTSATPRTRSRAGFRTSAWTRAPPTTRSSTRARRPATPSTPC